MVPPDSHRIPRVPRYSGCGLASVGFAYGPLTLCGRPFHAVPLAFLLTTSVPQPRKGRNPFGLGCSPFARRYLGNHVCFLLLRVLRCFSSPGSPRFRGDGCPSGCPIRISMDQRPLAPPHGISSLATSFLASWSLGIHRPPLLSFPSPTRRDVRPPPRALSYSTFSSFFVFSMSMVSSARLAAGQSPGASAPG